MTKVGPRPQRVFYMHIAKTAGTSVARSFVKAFGEEACRSHVQSILRDDVLTPREVVRQFRFVAGHLSLPRIVQLTAQNRRRWFVFTTVREPLSHVASHVKWVKALGLRLRQGEKLGMNPETKALARGLAKVNVNDIRRLERLFDGDVRALTLFHDCQTRYFLPQALRLLTPADAAAALEAAQTHLDAVIRTEDLAVRLPEILARFKVESAPPPPQDNMAPLEETMDWDDPKVKAFYSRLTAHDQIVYEAMS